MLLTLVQLSWELVMFVICTVLAYNNNNWRPPAENTSTLKHVLVINRHGHRLPLIGEIYPKDPYNFSKEINRDGYGALSNLGKNQEYNLGSQLRKRYNKLLGPYYSPNWLYARTTDFERTHMSEQAMLTGLYPPRGDQQWSVLVKNWQPIPIRSFPVDDDPILMGTPCKRYEQLFNDIYLSEVGQNITKQYQNLLDKLEEHTGMGMNLINASNICLMFEIEEGFNLKLPEWTKKFYPQPLKQIVGITYALEVWSEEMKRIRMGNLIEYIVDIMDARRNGETERRLTALSAHDNILVVLYRSLGFNNIIKPEYASSILIELHHTSSNEWFVKMFLDESGNASSWVTLSIPKCNNPCTLDKFIEAYSKLFDSDWDASCSSRRNSFGS